MGKRLRLLLAMLFTFSLIAAACSSEDAADDVEEAVEGEDEMSEEDMDEMGDHTAVRACLVTDDGGIDDKSFNTTAWKGVTDAIDAGYALAEGDDGSFFLESGSEADYQPNLDQLVNQGCEHIVSVGFKLADATATSSAANPDINFTAVDVDWLEGDNVLGLAYQTDEAAFLAGYLAAGMTETGIVGTFGGVNIPPVTIFMDGFAWGVAHYNEVNGTDVTVLGWDPANPDTGLFTEGFEANDVARSTAQGLLDEGADILLPVGGPINLSAAAAMQDLGMGANGDVFGALIGVDTDQFVSVPDLADLWLTSVEKRFDVTVAESIALTASGEFAGGVYTGTLENGGVGIADFHDFAGLVSDELAAEIDQLSADIISGAVAVG